VAILLPTKFYLPPKPVGAVERPQLLEKLDGVLTHRLTLVSAPAGAGKSVLVSDWVQSSRKKGATFGWLSLDDGDNDPDLFFGMLLAVIYITLYRSVYKRLPATLQTEKVSLSWRDLWYPGLLFLISMILGLKVIL